MAIKAKDPELDDLTRVEENPCSARSARAIVRSRANATLFLPTRTSRRGVPSDLTKIAATLLSPVSNYVSKYKQGV